VPLAVRERHAALLLFNLPEHHELDPRSSRVPLKIHHILRRAPGGTWVPAAGEPSAMFEIGRDAAE
jgi:hypothetical protein